MQAPMQSRSDAGATAAPRSIALVVDDELSNRVILKALLKRLGYQVTEARDGREAVSLFQIEVPDVVFMDVMMPEMDGYEAAARIKAQVEAGFVPIIFLTALTDENALVRCIEAGGDDFLTKPFSHAILRSKLQAMERIRALHHEVKNLYSRMRQEEEIAQEVFSTAVLADNVAMDVIPHRLQSAAIFSGDLLLTARTPSGDLHLLLGDFTGHGLSAALGALPTAEVFRAMTAKGFSPEQILTSVNRKLHGLLPTGMFLAATFVRLPHTLDYVQIFNCGLPEGLVLDAAGTAICHRVVSRLLPLGIVAQQDVAIGMQHIPVGPGWRVLLASDGVTEAHGPNGVLFGQARFEAAIAAAAGGPSSLDAINRALDEFCCDVPQADDISLVEIPCLPALFAAGAMGTQEPGPVPPIPKGVPGAAEILWQVALSLRGERLGQLDPVPLLINQIQELENDTFDIRPLFTLLTELYVNALDHGVLGLPSSLKADAEGFVRYFGERERRLAVLTHGHQVRLSVVCEQSGEDRHLRIRVEDSGRGFDHEAALAAARQGPASLHGRGIMLMRALCSSLTYEGRGNQVEAVYRPPP
jgi:two-component system, HptB-dependent secretion and biofilm response regulator